MMRKVRVPVCPEEYSHIAEGHAGSEKVVCISYTPLLSIWS
jgi:hypothetical protein